MPKEVSVVIATYNRTPLLRALLVTLNQQTLPAKDFEVLIVDDGSDLPAEAQLRGLKTRYVLKTIRQTNQGPAVARHEGVMRAKAPIVVFVDDDMHLPPDFLKHHLHAHHGGARLVQGLIEPAPQLETMPLFERFHARQLDQFVRDYLAGKRQLRGVDICTGNLSVNRQDYLKVGGFDATLGRSEDRDLGIRMERAQIPMAFAPEARCTHGSDHTDLNVWLKRAYLYGVFDHRIAQKYPDTLIADPWRFFFMVSPLSKPFILTALVAPPIGKRLARASMTAAMLIDRLGMDRPALAGTTLCYGLQYFRGVRHNTGSLKDCVVQLRHFARQDKATQKPPHNGKIMHLKSSLDTMMREIRDDYDAVIGYRRKYNHEVIPASQLPVDMVKKIGVQMMAAIRFMRFLRDAPSPFAAKMASRMIRHMYGAEIHWDAEISPGVSIIHGNGLVISHGAKISSGCILFHNVTLGEGIDVETRQIGSPTLEKNVHIGPGATLLGPIVIGEGSKIMAGTVVTQSLPPNSIAKPPQAVVEKRLRTSKARKDRKTTEAARKKSSRTGRRIPPRR
ncbi:MAG: glycosyltransferase [Myxococcota bacterium]